MELAEIRELGIYRGYDAANFAEAYGGTASFEGWPYYVTTDAEQVEFVGAFQDGVARFERGEWPDGTPREDGE